jgi:hypothetical protein
VGVRLDPEVLDWLRAIFGRGGEGHLTALAFEASLSGPKSAGVRAPLTKFARNRFSCNSASVPLNVSIQAISTCSIIPSERRLS